MEEKTENIWVSNNRNKKEYGAFYSSRCTAMKIKTKLQYTFFDVEIWWFLTNDALAYCFMEGCFVSMDFCVSHTCFINLFTSSTSALYTLPVAFIRFAIWFRLPLIFPSV